MKIRRPSPALVISCIALVASCAGTAYAATMITSSKQIKNGTILSADIKDRSIQGRDIKNGTITRNKLSRGAAAVTGSSAGGGPASVHQVVRKAGPEAQPANAMIKVASLNVPPGAYLVTASTVMTALPGPQNPLLPERDSPSGRCHLNAAGEQSQSLQNVVVNSKTTPATLFMQVTRTVGEPAEFFLECGAGSVFRLSETSIIATRVSDISLTTAP